MPVNMSFGLISAHKPSSSTVLLYSLALFQKKLSAVVWRLRPWRLVQGTAGLHAWLAAAFYPFHPSEPNGGVVVEAEGLSLWCLQEWELPVHERIHPHPTLSVLHG